MKTLSTRQLALARAISAALFDDGEAGVPEERLSWVARELKAHFVAMGTQTRLAFRAAFWVVQFLPILWGLKLRRFARLSLADRVRFLSWLETSRFGLILVLLKTVLGTVYFEHPDALARTGYDGLGLLGPTRLLPAVSPVEPKEAPIDVGFALPVLAGAESVLAGPEADEARVLEGA